ncbi:MAG: MoaD/ThiS family protein [Actinomycetota bacterium]
MEIVERGSVAERYRFWSAIGQDEGMAHLRLFASIREAAGTGSASIAGETVGEVLDAAITEYGGPDGDFAGLLATCNVWCNGEPADRDHSVNDTDEVAVLPPVSGG